MTAYILCLPLLEHLVTSASPRRTDREDGGAVQMYGRNCHFMLRIGGKAKLHNREKKIVALQTSVAPTQSCSHF